jgi:hypothetical protein
MKPWKDTFSTAIASIGAGLVLLGIVTVAGSPALAHHNHDCVTSDCIDSCYFSLAGDPEGEPCGGSCSQCYCGCYYPGGTMDCQCG